MSIDIHGSVQPQGVSAINHLIDTETLSSATYMAETTSTNSAALEHVRQGGVPENQMPRLYLADSQTAGRGRHGRTWISKDDSLTFSLVMKRSITSSPTTSLWPIAVGVAIARAIEFCFAPLRTQLKWPNDVHLDGSKVAGILLETIHGTPEFIVIGIGVNTNTSPAEDEMTGPIAQSAVAQSIAAVVGRPVDRYSLLTSVIEQVIEATHQAATTPMEIVDDYQNRCALSGKSVCYLECGKQQTATCRGINALGELLLETPSGVKACNTGEVNLVRIR